MQYSALLEELGISLTAIASRGLPVCAEAHELELAECGPDGREHLLAPTAADAWRRVKTAAASENVSIHIVSGFRSVDRQAEIIRRKLSAGQRIEDVLCVSAPPGFSEHHTGCAVDIGIMGTPDLQLAFEATPAFAWLLKRAGEFGFRLSYPRGNPYGYQYEPWHWCFVAD